MLDYLNKTWFRLIGVVGLKELRKAIEDANSGQVTRTHMHQIRAEEVLACFILTFSCSRHSFVIKLQLEL